LRGLRAQQGQNPRNRVKERSSLEGQTGIGVRDREVKSQEKREVEEGKEKKKKRPIKLLGGGGELGTEGTILGGGT